MRNRSYWVRAGFEREWDDGYNAAMDRDDKDAARPTYDDEDAGFAWDSGFDDGYGQSVADDAGHLEFQRAAYGG